MRGAEQLNSELTGEQAELKTAPCKNNKLLQVACLAVIAGATLLCYSPVLFNFFNGDDFVHLTWLVNAIHQPELVWRNFYTSWLDGTTTKFYRPLISVFMVSDYAIWGVNGLGFRLTNLLFHLTSTILIFLIGKHLQNESQVNESASSSTQEQSNSLEWPLAAAALFALYPLHPEAVSWITGRVDSVVTAFCLGSIYFYIRFSKAQKLIFLTLSLLSATLGLLSKEMAITLPAVFLFYELVYQIQWSKLISTASRTKECITFFKPVFKTTPFWFLLVLYFGVRYLALGTLVGGYDNSLLFIPNLAEFIKGWQHAIVMMIVPINKSLLGSHHLLSKIWPAVIIYCSSTTLLNVILEPRNRRHVLFLTGWLFCCLAPVYKLFNIADDLQGSRLAYLATVPLCMLLTASMLQCSKLNKLLKFWKSISILMMLVLLSLSSALLYTNNQPWRLAGLENNAIRAQLQALYDQIPGDPEILFLGLPDQIQGAYTCRNSLDGMTKKPQLNRDIRNCLMVNAFEPIFPFGFLKDSIADSNGKILIFRWDDSKKSFAEVKIEKQGSAGKIIEWKGEKLKEISSLPEQKSKPEIHWNADGSPTVTCAKQGELELNLGSQSCFSCDFVELNLDLDRAAEAGQGADLLYSNDMFPAFELRRRAHADYKTGEKKQRLIFAMRGLPEWSLGGQTHPFRLLVPGGTKMQINSVSLVPKQYLTPELKFENSGYFGTKGYLHLGPKEPKQSLQIEVSQVPNASGFSVEITRANLLFEAQNPQKGSKVAQSNQVHEKISESVILEFKDFNTPGIYELRAFPLSKDGEICGAASDHIVISVDPKN